MDGFRNQRRMDVGQLIFRQKDAADDSDIVVSHKDVSYKW